MPFASLTAQTIVRLCTSKPVLPKHSVATYTYPAPYEESQEYMNLEHRFKFDGSDKNLQLGIQQTCIRIYRQSRKKLAILGGGIGSGAFSLLL